MIIKNLKQGSPEWFDARNGIITGSRAKEAYKKDTSVLLDLLISEKLTGEMEQIYTTADMQRGIDLEPLARNDYKDFTGFDVREVGICLSDTKDYLAVSPDGLIYGDDQDELKPIGGLEIKCPKSKTHIKYIRTGIIPKEYKAQILHYFIVCESIEWLDFVSYDPRVTIRPLNIVRVTRVELFDDLVKANYDLNLFNDKMVKEYNKIIF